MRGGARPGAGRPRGSRNRPKPRPPLSPAKRVEVLVAAGAPLERIALEMKISVEQLERDFQRELTIGAAERENDLDVSLYDQAHRGNASLFRLWYARKKELSAARSCPGPS